MDYVFFYNSLSYLILSGGLIIILNLLTNRFFYISFSSKLVSLLYDFVYTALVLFLLSLFTDVLLKSEVYLISISSQYDSIFYKLSNLWGSHEGSYLMLVCFVVIFYNIFFTVLVKTGVLIRKHPSTLMLISSAMVVMMHRYGVVNFLTSINFKSAEIYKSSNAPTNILDGFGISPLLQDISMGIHPVLLFLSYSILLFSFSVGAVHYVLFDVKDKDSSHNLKKILFLWILVGWLCITISISLGSYWAYYELGWGGWWFWDPVENYSAVPWFLSLGVLHIIRSVPFVLIYYTLGLVGILTLLGMFVIRYGISIESVHSFVSSNNSYLDFLYIVVSLCLLYFIADRGYSRYSNIFNEVKVPERTISSWIVFIIALLFGLITFLITTIPSIFTNLLANLNGADFLNLTMFCLFGGGLYLLLLYRNKVLLTETFILCIPLVIFTLIFSGVSVVLLCVLSLYIIFIYLYKKKLKYSYLAHTLVLVTFTVAIFSFFSEECNQFVINLLPKMFYNVEVYSGYQYYPYFFLNKCSEGSWNLLNYNDLLFLSSYSNYYFPLEGIKHTSPFHITDFIVDYQSSLLLGNLVDGACFKIIYSRFTSLMWLLLAFFVAIYLFFIGKQASRIYI